MANDRRHDWLPNADGAEDWDERVSRIVPDLVSRGWRARGECSLWLAVVEDAQTSAKLLGRRRRLLGMDERRRSLPTAIAREAAMLREWATADYPGSLLWIAHQVSGAIGVEIHADRVRREVLEALDGGPGDEPANPRRSRAAARGKVRIVRISDL